MGAGAHQQLGQQLTAEGERRRVQIRIAGRKIRVGVIPRLVVVILDIEILHLAVVYAQRAAGIVDVLPVERLRKKL